MRCCLWIRAIADKALANNLAFAIENYAASEVTVNEQNPLAIGFYKHMGFQTYKRTDFDEEGNPYPLLYMRLMK